MTLLSRSVGIGVVFLLHICSEEKIPTISSNSRISPLSLLCSSTRHIHNTCTWYIQTLLLFCDLGLPTLALPIATRCIDMYLSLDPAKVPCI